MKMSLLTIVIPVYNAEDVLQRSMDSLLNQTDKDFDIVLVDDGSTDSSAKICDKYAKQHKNIRAIHTNNAGTSSAKNRGINVVDTEYVTFCDSDDFYSETFTEDIIKVIKFNSPDCICFGWQYVTKEGVQPARIPKLPYNRILNRDFIHNTILPPMLNLVDDKDRFIDDFAVNKVYRADLIKQNGICFDERRRIWEDRIFVVEYLKYCETFYCMDKAYYNYIQVEGSLSSKYYLNFFDIIFDNFQKYYKWYSNEYDFDNQYSNNYWCHSIENMIVRSLEQKENKKIIKENITNVFDNPLVVQWYTKRSPLNQTEKKATELLLSKQYNELLSLYNKMRKNSYRKIKIRSAEYLIKSRIAKVLSRK